MHTRRARNSMQSPVNLTLVAGHAVANGPATNNTLSKDNEMPNQSTKYKKLTALLLAATTFAVTTANASDGQAPNNAASSTSATSFLNYLGYITYAGLAAGAFGHDDPLQIQTRATRFFQEKFLHHHAIDNPQVWAAMGDLMMSRQHLAEQGVHAKPLKLKTLSRGAGHESKQRKQQRQDLAHNAREAESILQDISSGLRGPSDYVLAARFLYLEAIAKADARAEKEAIDHSDEKRLDGRLKMLSEEPDRVAAFQARDNSITPLEDELGARVSLRLDTAAFLERYGSHVPELGWSNLAAKLRSEAQAIYADQKALSEPVRRRLQQRYPNGLIDNPQV